jgi:serine/threonine protein kinase
MSTKLDPEELQLVEPPIGDGSFGTVYRGRYKTQDVAIKILKFQDLGDRKRDFEREIRIMEGLRSPFVVGFIGAVTIPGRLCLVTEYVPHGSLGAMLGRTKLSNSLKTRICLDCARGMAYLHSSKMMHRESRKNTLLLPASLSPFFCSPL